MLLKERTGQSGGTAGPEKPKLVKKALLLIVEIIAVAGLLLAALEMWQVQQTLLQDLSAAKEVQAIIRDGEGSTAAQGTGENSRELRPRDLDGLAGVGRNTINPRSPGALWGSAMLPEEDDG